MGFFYPGNGPVTVHLLPELRHQARLHRLDGGLARLRALHLPQLLRVRLSLRCAGRLQLINLPLELRLLALHRLELLRLLARRVLQLLAQIRHLLLQLPDLRVVPRARVPLNVPIHLSPLFAWIGEVGVLDVLSLGTAAGEAQVRQELACVRDVMYSLS